MLRGRWAKTGSWKEPKEAVGLKFVAKWQSHLRHRDLPPSVPADLELSQPPLPSSFSSVVVTEDQFYAVIKQQFDQASEKRETGMLQPEEFKHLLVIASECARVVCLEQKMEDRIVDIAEILADFLEFEVIHDLEDIISMQVLFEIENCSWILAKVCEKIRKLSERDREMELRLQGLQFRMQIYEVNSDDEHAKGQLVDTTQAINGNTGDKSDKATVETEYLEEGYVAKIVHGDGTKEIKVGQVVKTDVDKEAGPSEDDTPLSQYEINEWVEKRLQLISRTLNLEGERKDGVAQDQINKWVEKMLQLISWTLGLDKNVAMDSQTESQNRPDQDEINGRVGKMLRIICTTLRKRGMKCQTDNRGL